MAGVALLRLHPVHRMLHVGELLALVALVLHRMLHVGELLALMALVSLSSWYMPLAVAVAAGTTSTSR
jgi:hypothetical protein